MRVSWFKRLMFRIQPPAQFFKRARRKREAKYRDKRKAGKKWRHLSWG